MDSYNTQLLLNIWNHFWFSQGIIPEVNHTPEGLTDNQWIQMVYSELLNRNIWPINDGNDWYRSNPEDLIQLRMEMK